MELSQSKTKIILNNKEIVLLKGLLELAVNYLKEYDEKIELNNKQYEAVLFGEELIKQIDNLEN